MYVASTRAKDCMVVSTYEGALGGRRAWSSLDDYIHSVPEFEAPDVKAVAEREKLRLVKGEWEAAREKIKEQRDVVAAPSYAVESVTSLAKKDMEVPEWRRGSYGMAWGRAVHKMLEIVGKWDGNGDGEDADKYFLKLIQLAKNVLVAEEMSLDKKGELVRLVDVIVRSEFWERVKQAERKLFEVPFSIMTEKSALGITTEDMKKGTTESDKKQFPIILTGSIDLAFLESGGWVIADYKTDDVSTALQSFVEYYTPQVQIYCRHWAEITQQPIKEAGLYFTSINKWVRIDLKELWEQ
jgi:ATP-dependent helicase/nuclease subunit A